MAGRTSTNFGMGAAITILSLLALGFFVAFAVFFGKASNLRREIDQARQDQNDVVKADERNRDDIRTMIEAAKTNRQSLVTYLVDSQAATMEKVAGERRLTLANLNDRLKTVAGADSAPVLTVLSNRESEIANLKGQLDQADKARLTALADLTNEVARVTGIESRHQDTINALNTEVAQLRAEVEQYRQGTNDYKSQLDAQRDRLVNEFGEKEASLTGQLTKLTEEKLIIESQLQACRGQKNLATLKGDDESALVDATVIGTNNTDRQAFISIGRKQKVVLGMTFAVYSDKGALRPDPDGNYPRGKATLEVTSVGENSSTARITSEVKGNPVVKGDVIANAIFDPNKAYKFVVFGNFDTNRDGVGTSLERQDIQAMIVAWGGSTVEEVVGDVDFVVLGERPVVPPRPAPNAPLEVVQEFIRRQREVERYDALHRQATSTAVPVVNENRLYTLIGKTPSAQR